MFSRQVLLVKPVPGLVQDAEERFAEKLRVVASQDAGIAGPDAGAKRVRRRIEPTGIEVEAQGDSGPLAEDFLPFNWKFAVQDVSPRRLAGLGNSVNERH